MVSTLENKQKAIELESDLPLQMNLRLSPKKKMRNLKALVALVIMSVVLVPITVQAESDPSTVGSYATNTQAIYGIKFSPTDLIVVIVIVLIVIAIFLYKRSKK